MRQESLIPKEPPVINRIRTETALTKFPIHQLAKGKPISIDLLSKTPSGKVGYRWKVSANSSVGKPGPLAYKLDTLVINRVLDETKRPLPEILKLGSLADISRQLDNTGGGANQRHIRTALRQNAAAFIEAHITYKTADGTIKTLEINDNRYGVIFAGSELPDGSKADAVYITLSSWFRELQNRVQLRPLDYDYLKALTGGAQRFYEIASFAIYGSILHGKSTASLRYSDFCVFAPVTRYSTYDEVKKQMYKIHRPHRASGYLKGSVDFRATVDEKGDPDWEMIYTPGWRACAEYYAFSRKGQNLAGLTEAIAVRTIDIVPPPPANHKPEEAPVQASLELDTGLPERLVVAELIKRGIRKKTAEQLIAEAKDLDTLRDQIEYADWVIAQGSIKQPTGFYVSMIRERTPLPEGFITSRKHKEVLAAQDARLREENHQQIRELAYLEYRRCEVERHLAAMEKEEFAGLLSAQEKEVSQQYKKLPRDEQTSIALQQLRHQLAESGVVPLLSRDEFEQGGAASLSTLIADDEPKGTLSL